MRRREFVGLLGAAAAWPFTAHAQQPTPVLAYLSARSREAEVTMLAGFRKGLAEAGFIENRNVAIEFRFADGQVDRLPALAAELALQQLAVLVAVGGRAASPRGPEVTEVLSIEAAPQMMVQGAVKWFDANKGFGFIKSDAGKDIFISLRILRHAGLSDLTEGQRVEVETVDAPKGPEARSIRIVSVAA